MVKCLRKYFDDFTTWKDKESEKHKHNYSIHHILQVKNPMDTRCYNVLKCDKCNSFTSIKEEHNINGAILTSLTEEQLKLPFIYGKKHNYFIDLNEFDELQFPDGYIYIKRKKEKHARNSRGRNSKKCSKEENTK